MEYSIEEWKGKKEKLSKDIVENIYSKVCAKSKKDMQQWTEYAKEFPIYAMENEVNAYQHILIFNLMLKYNIHCPEDKLDDVLENLIIRLSFDEDIAKSQMQINQYLELANLVSFLQKAMNENSGITIKQNIGTSTSSIKIEDKSNLYDLYRYSDALLYYQRNHIYKEQFGWKDKQLFTQISLPLSLKSNNKNISQESNLININEFVNGTKTFDEPYSDEDLNKIIAFENDNRGTVRNYAKIYRNNMLNEAIDELREYKIFSTEYKIISTPEACFLYDVLQALETIPYDDTKDNQEKFQYIKRHRKK